MKAKLLVTIAIFHTLFGIAQFGPQQIISTTTEKPYRSIPVDVDNDGYMDIVAMGAQDYNLTWYRNLDGLGNFGQEIEVNQEPIYYISVDFADIDSDGDNDILYQSNNPSYIAWMENLDGAGNFGPKQIIDQPDYTSSVKAIDLDNDGDLDLLTTVTDTFTGWMTWFENQDGQGDFGPENLLLENDNEFSKIALEDIDSDGLLDVLATDYVYSQGKIFWYKNIGNGTLGPMQVIHQFLWVSGGTNITNFEYADINTDGKKDIVITWVDDNTNYGTDWLENLDNSGNFGPLQFLMNDTGSYKFYDFDNDGDNDILLWNSNANLVAWKKNEDGHGTFGLKQTVTTEVDFPRDAKAADFNGDGWLDVASASIADNKLAWYKNNTLGISENEIANYQIYPNPTNGILYIESKQPISQISVFNLLGQSIEKKQNTNQIDLSKTEAGVYLLKFEDANGNSQTHKIVKE